LEGQVTVWIVYIIVALQLRLYLPFSALVTRLSNLTMQEQSDNGMGMGAMMREVQELAEKFKVEEDEHYTSPYAHLEKAQVLQEAR
jgi:hypothetical protein